MNIPGLNEVIPVEDLQKLNDALRKSTTAGYQDTSGPVSYTHLTLPTSG